MEVGHFYSNLISKHVIVGLTVSICLFFFFK